MSSIIVAMGMVLVVGLGAVLAAIEEDIVAKNAIVIEVDEDEYEMLTGESY